MEDIKEILMFIGYSFQRFFIHVLYHFAYLFLVTAVTIAVFFLSYSTFENHYFFMVYLFILLVLNYKAGNFLYYKSQLRLNLGYIDFLQLAEDKKQDYLQMNIQLPANPGGKIKTVKENLKKGGAGFIPGKLLLAIAAIQIKNEGTITETKVPGSREYTVKILFFQFCAFFILLIPFGLISFFFTMGQAAGVKYLVYLLGFFFVYFLNAAILEPIACLMIQKKIYEAATV